MINLTIEKNLQDVRAYKLDYKCVKNYHNDYENCVYVANSFSDTKTLVSVLYQPIFRVIMFYYKIKFLLTNKGE